jgi:hypothetical protein
MKYFSAALLAGSALGQDNRPSPPGKNTIPTAHAMQNLEFMLKYMPVAVAEDNGAGNEAHGAINGRSQTLRENRYTERNCQLYSAAGSKTSSSAHVSMTQNGLGQACSYSSGKSYGSSNKQHMVFANNQAQCCNACVATEGCVAATFKTSSNDQSGGMGPQSWEGFGVHQPDVTARKTTGGLSLDGLEAKYDARLGDFSEFDAFMDYSSTFYTQSFQSYIDAFKADGVSHFVGQWSAGSDTWYSLIFKIPGGTYVIELVSQTKPSGAASLPTMEQRLAPARISEFKGKTTSPDNLMLIASINRATSDVDRIDEVYTGMFKMSTTHTISGQVSRKCYDGGRGFDICFTQRPETDSSFTVKDHEDNMWGVHAGTMTSPSISDKYTHHGGYTVPQAGISYLKSYFSSNDPYPLSKSTDVAYACFQSYVFDPTGFSIQVGGPGRSLWSGCNFDDVSV